MAYKSKYTGLQIDDILDSVSTKQSKIDDLASIRAGAAKGATALQSYTEKYTGTVTGIKINGETKSGSGIIDLGTISTDISGKQDKLVDGVNIATINGQSLTEGGDLTIEGGAKIYEWFYDGESESVTLSQEEYDNIVEADIVIVNLGGLMSCVVSKSSKEFSEAAGGYFLVGQIDLQGNKMHVHITISISTKLATITLEQQEIPTKTSQLENDNNFITSEDVAAVALSGSYNDLHDTPTIPSAVTESTVSGWGFTKNTGTYSKPSGGIPKSDLASAVQTSLGKADTAIQSTSFGELTDLALVKGFESAQKGTVYALPDEANGDEDDILLSRSSVKTVNGQSIVGSGDLTIESGAKVYELDLTGRGNFEGYITEEEWNIIKTSDRIKIITDIFSTEIVQIYSPFFELVGDVAAFGSLMGMQGGAITNYMFTGANTTESSPYSYHIAEVHIPTKTSQLENDSNFVSSNDLKTINGESILGSGNITISGGGSSTGGNGAYSEVNHGTSDTTFTLTPNTFHVWDEVANLTITLGSETAGVANEYLFQFTSGATATTLSLPSDLKWANDSAPTIVENMIYQMSILKGFASVLEFKKTVIISFSINGNPYQAEYGMTWKNFVDSPYNDGKVILNGSLCFYNGIPIFNSSMSSVESSQYIEANANYTASQGSGGA